MKKIKLIALLMVVALGAMACQKEAPKNTNTTTTVKPANTNTSPAPAPTAAKTEVKPVATAGGENVYSHPEGGIQFEVPPTWKAEADGEMMTLTTADSTLSIIFWVPKENTIEDALDALDSEFGKIMKNIKHSGEPQKGMLNGMTTYTVSGTGSIDGTSIEWSSHLIEAKKPVIALTFAAPDSYDKYEKDLSAFVKSIKKTS
jgi:hypothetical protein